MKKIVVSAFTAAVVLIACSPKTVPNATTTPVTSAGMPVVAVKTASEIEAGHTIFTTNCTKCHGEQTNYVTSHTYAETIPVMNAMAKKAKLTQEQINQLAAYVNSIAKK